MIIYQYNYWQQSFQQLRNIHYVSWESVMSIQNTHTETTDLLVAIRFIIPPLFTKPLPSLLLPSFDLVLVLILAALLDDK